MSKIDFDVDGIRNVHFKVNEYADSAFAFMMEQKERMLESLNIPLSEIATRVVAMRRSDTPNIEQYFVDNKPICYTEIKWDNSYTITFSGAPGCHPLFRFLEVSDDEQG